MKVKIITDSASNMMTLDGIPFTSVPLRIVTEEKEYIDHTDLDVHQMGAGTAFLYRTLTDCMPWNG